MAATEERPLAVVTGASSGIGFELARQFAEHGYDLIIAAEDEAITTDARELQNGTTVEAVKVDLATANGVEHLYARIRQHDDQLEAVALNAGIGMGGDFATGTDLDQELRLVDLNVRSTVHLAKRVVGDMVKRGNGKVLFTSSITSLMAERVVSHSLSTKAQGHGSRLMPDKLKSAMHGKMAEPGSADDE